VRPRGTRARAALTRERNSTVGAVPFEPFYPPPLPAHPYAAGFVMEPVDRPEEPRLEENTTVFVGNLDPTVTEEQLKEHFEHHGAITHVRRRRPPPAVARGAD